HRELSPDSNIHRRRRGRRAHCGEPNSRRASFVRRQQGRVSSVVVAPAPAVGVGQISTGGRMYHRAPGITSLVEIAGRTGRSGVACGMRLAGVARRTTLAATMLLIALGGTVEAQQATIAARTTAHDRFTPPLDRGI